VQSDADGATERLNVTPSLRARQGVVARPRFPTDVPALPVSAREPGDGTSARRRTLLRAS
jgi:hypothetical protein